MRNPESSLSFHPVVAPQRRLSPCPGASRLSLLGLFALVVLGGCASGDVSIMVPVSTGEKVRVPFGHGGPVFTEEDGVKIEADFSAPDEAKKNMIYTFEFSDARSRALRSVKVEDVSDDTATVLVDDSSPELNKGHWRRVSRSLGPDEDCLKWIFNLENTVRVFRFTIVFADGHKLVLDQGSMYPNVIKAGIRRMFGKTY